MDAETLERAIQLRKELPSRWTSTLLDILKHEGKLVGKGPHRATLDRHLACCGASRRLMHVLGEKRTIKMCLAYADLRTDPTFDIGAFLDVLTGLAGLTPSPSEDKESRAFWDTYGPIPETLVRTAVEHAVRMHGRGRHVRLYLNAVQTLILAHWRNPKEPS